MSEFARLLAQNSGTLIQQLDQKIDSKLAPIQDQLGSMERRQNTFADELKTLTLRVDGQIDGSTPVGHGGPKMAAAEDNLPDDIRSDSCPQGFHPRRLWVGGVEGKHAVLYCSYRSVQPVYSVRWYKSGKEFFR